MIKIFNLNDYPLSIKNGAYGGAAGSKDGISINGTNWLIKYPMSLSQMQGDTASYSSAPLSEFLGSHIYEIIGFDTHKTILGERNNKIVVGCKDFETDGSKLLEIRTIKNYLSPELYDILSSSVASSENHLVDFQELMLHLNKNPLLNSIEGIKQHFFEQAIVDIFISNNDRNNGNWGIIRKPGQQDRIAPIFDNGGSFHNKITDDKICKIMNSSEMQNNSINILTAYAINGHQCNAKKFMKAVEAIPEYRLAINKIVPIIKECLPQIKELIDEIPEKHILENGKEITVFSPDRKEMYFKQMGIRLNDLLIPEYERFNLSVEQEEIDTMIKEALDFTEQLENERNTLDEAIRNTSEMSEDFLDR